jgi:hypothetical protein
MSPDPGGEIAPFPCTKPRGHRSNWHTGRGAKRRWQGGINTPARWEAAPDDGYRSEGEYAAMRQMGVRW